MTSRDDVGPILNGIPTHLPDIDPAETQEWLDSLDAVIDGPGRMRARYLSGPARCRSACRPCRPPTT